MVYKEDLQQVQKLLQLKKWKSYEWLINICDLHAKILQGKWFAQEFLFSKLLVASSLASIFCVFKFSYF